MKFASDFGLSTLLHANLNAFKFPEKDSLHFVCDVEVKWFYISFTHPQSQSHNVDVYKLSIGFGTTC